MKGNNIMYINKNTNKKMYNLAKSNGEEVNSDNFTFYSSQCLINEFIEIIENRKCTVKDINMIIALFPKMLLSLEVKEGCNKHPSF